MKKPKLILLTLLFVFIILSSGISNLYSFEKGDAIYRMKTYAELLLLPDWFSHAGLTCGYKGTGDPQLPENQLIIESLPGEGVVISTLEEFYNASSSLDFRTMNPSYIVRNNIVQSALNVVGSSYPDAVEAVLYKGPSFRCDGLVEYCYETVGIDVIPNDTCVTLNPDRQRNAMLLSVSVSPTVKLTDAEGNIIEDGSQTSRSSIFVIASDSVTGSGLSLVEYWHTPSGSIEPINSIRNYYDLDHTYALTNLSNGEWNIRVYDQAGNFTTRRIIVDNQDSDGDGEPDYIRSRDDNDGDGIPDWSDPIPNDHHDMDNDGVRDDLERQTDERDPIWVRMVPGNGGVLAERQLGMGEYEMRNYPVQEWGQSLGNSSICPGQAAYPMVQNVGNRLTAHFTGGYTKSVYAGISGCEGKWMGKDLPVSGVVGIGVTAYAGGMAVLSKNASMSFEASSGTYKTGDKVNVSCKGNGYLDIEGELLKAGIDPGTITSVSYSISGDVMGRDSTCQGTLGGIRLANYFPQHVASVGNFGNSSGIGCGSLLVADNDNRVIKVYSSTGVYVKDIGAGILTNPAGVAKDPSGLIYVADGNRVIVFDSTGTVIYEIPGFSAARSIAVRNSMLYVVDKGASVVKVYDAGRNLVREVGTGDLSQPSDIDIDDRNNMYVADTQNHRVVVYDSLGQLKWMLGEYGTGIGQLNYPEGLAIDKDGNVYVADTGNNQVQIFDGSGKFKALISYDGDPLYKFISPKDVVIDADGFLWILDSGQKRAMKYKFTRPLVYDPPQVSINYPVNGRLLTADEFKEHKLAIKGTVKATKIAKWSLLYGNGLAPTQWTEFYSSTSPVVDGTLTDWDLTDKPQGIYSVKLRLQYETVNAGQTNVREEEAVIGGIIIPDWYRVCDTFEETSDNLFWLNDYPNIKDYPWQSGYVSWGTAAKWSKLTDVSQAHSGEKFWKAEIKTDMQNFLVSPLLSLSSGVPAGLKFWTKYNFTYAKGEVDVSIDNGQTWEKIYPVNQYPYMDTYSDGIYFRSCPAWVQEAFDLKRYQGKQIRVRFNISRGSGGDPTQEYWCIDDVELGSNVVVNPMDYTGGPLTELTENGSYGRIGWVSGSNKTSWRQSGSFITVGHQGGAAYVSDLDEYLYTPKIRLDEGIGYTLTFSHQYYTEGGKDGGNVEISADNGQTWELLAPDGGYPGTVDSLNASGFSGTNPSSIRAWDPVKISLSAYAGKTVVGDQEVTDIGSSWNDAARRDGAKFPAGFSFF